MVGTWSTPGKCLFSVCFRAPWWFQLHGDTQGPKPHTFGFLLVFFSPHLCVLNHESDQWGLEIFSMVVYQEQMWGALCLGQTVLSEPLGCVTLKQEIGMEIQLSRFWAEICPSSICYLLGEMHLTPRSPHHQYSARLQEKSEGEKRSMFVGTGVHSLHCWHSTQPSSRLGSGSLGDYAQSYTNQPGPRAEWVRRCAEWFRVWFENRLLC